MSNTESHPVDLAIARVGSDDDGAVKDSERMGDGGEETMSNGGRMNSRPMDHPTSSCEP